jgi:hypothetical protein
MKLRPNHTRNDVARASLAALHIILGLAAAHAQTAGGAAKRQDDIAGLQGEWRRNGASFACRVEVKQRLAPDAISPQLLSRACQRMGPFGVGDDAQVLKTAFGAPHRTLPQPNGAVAWLYFLEQRDHHPYLVATVSKSRIIALQVTGPTAAKGYSFNHIDLGVTTDALVQVFGQPLHFEPSEEKDTELWTYGVWPFSFEVSGGQVRSIRINEP